MTRAQLPSVDLTALSAYLLMGRIRSADKAFKALNGYYSCAVYAVRYSVARGFFGLDETSKRATVRTVTRI